MIHFSPETKEAAVAASLAVSGAGGSFAAAAHKTHCSGEAVAVRVLPGRLHGQL